MAFLSLLPGVHKCPLSFRWRYTADSGLDMLDRPRVERLFGSLKILHTPQEVPSRAHCCPPDTAPTRHQVSDDGATAGPITNHRVVSGEHSLSA